MEKEFKDKKDHARMDGLQNVLHKTKNSDCHVPFLTAKSYLANGVTKEDVRV